MKAAFFIGGFMDARIYLSQVETVNMQVRTTFERIQELKAQVENITSFWGDDIRVQDGTRHDKMDVISEYIDLENGLYSQMLQAEKLKLDIIKRLEKLATNEYIVLYDRYINGRTYSEIAENMDKSYSWTTSTASKGIKRLQKMLDNER